MANVKSKKPKSLITIVGIVLFAFIYSYFFPVPYKSREVKGIQNEVGHHKILLEKITKRFDDNPSDPRITFAITLVNNTEEDIQAFEGVVTFYDNSYNEIGVKVISPIKGLQAHHRVTLEEFLDYDNHYDARVKLKETEMKNLIYSWMVTRISYTDGTQETF